MKITFILLIAFVSMNYSCESQNISPKSELIEAVILDGGPIPTENCGWIIKVNDSYYSPSNLSQEFEKDKTIITVSHRLSTVRRADHIFVLKDGRIVEEGKHADLVKKKSAYYTLFESQL